MTSEEAQNRHRVGRDSHKNETIICIGLQGERLSKVFLWMASGQNIEIDNKF